MSIFKSIAPPLHPPPDNLTVPQFLLDDLSKIQIRPVRPRGIPCLIDEETGKSVDHEEMCSRTDALSRAMYHKWGIRQNDVVALYAPNHIDYPVAVWAIHRLGAIVAMTSATLTTEELTYQLQIAKPSLMLAHVENLPTALEAGASVGLSRANVLVYDAHKATSELPCKSVDEIIDYGRTCPPFPEVRFGPGEAKQRIAILCFSSGTTGKPKAVAVSHYNMICNVLQAATMSRVGDESAPQDQRWWRPGDRALAVLPLYHIYGLIASLHFCIFAAMTVVVVRKFSFESMLSDIERYRITHLFLVPPQVVLICKHPSIRNYDLSSVRVCMVAAAPLSAELTQQMLEIMPTIHLGQGYGLTETCAAVSFFPPSQHVGTPGSAGQLMPGTIAKIVKPDGSHASVGEPGELWVKGGQVSLGYYRNEDATKESFIDGWFRTGDEVVFHENGDLFIRDRIKELIKVKGNQVAPAEIEGHLLGHPDVADAAVIGVPDDFAGELPMAYIVLHAKIAAEVRHDTSKLAAVHSSIFKHVADTKSSYKWLTGGIEFVEAIPKSPSGKILRRLLRDRVRIARQRTPRAHL